MRRSRIVLVLVLVLVLEEWLSGQVAEWPSGRVARWASGERLGIRMSGGCSGWFPGPRGMNGPPACPERSRRGYPVPTFDASAFFASTFFTSPGF
jgi:hypothetical protein